MKRFALFIALFTAMTTVGTAWEREDKTEPRVRLEIDLVDGSHITGIPRIQSVPVQSSYAKMDIALKEIRSIKFDADHETASLDLMNGDKLKGVVSLAPIKLETVFGMVRIGTEHIRELRVVSSGGTLPVGEGTLSYGGVNWMPWRTAFEVQGDKLVSLPKARPGFSYGHGGN